MAARIQIESGTWINLDDGTTRDSNVISTAIGGISSELTTFQTGLIVIPGPGDTSTDTKAYDWFGRMKQIKIVGKITSSVNATLDLLEAIVDPAKVSGVSVIPQGVYESDRYSATDVAIQDFNYDIIGGRQYMAEYVLTLVVADVIGLT